MPRLTYGAAQCRSESELNIYYDYLESPLGELLAIASDKGLTGLHLPGASHTPAIQAHWQRSAARFASLRGELADYFAGRRASFQIELDTGGSPFQAAVWRALREIPYGRTSSYRDIAERIGRPRAIRAVGAANGRNPVSIIVPCHRVIGADGSLTGYAGGLPAKRYLLGLEGQARTE